MHVRAKLFVSFGAKLHSRGGETSSLSQVWRASLQTQEGHTTFLQGILDDGPELSFPDQMREVIRVVLGNVTHYDPVVIDSHDVLVRMSGALAAAHEANDT